MSSSSEDNEEIPSQFMCPITRELMSDPVLCSDEHSYERKAITQWLRTKNTSPVTRDRLRSNEMITNRGLKRAIQQYLVRRSTKKIQLLVRAEKTSTVEVSKYATVQELREEVTSKLGFSYEVMAYRGKVLVNEETLKHYKIKGGDTIQLSIRMRGGELGTN